MSYSCWALSDADRDRLLEIIPPLFPDVIAHHVTLKNPSSTAPEPAEITIVEEVVDPDGVQALVVTVSINGSTPTTKRDDGNYYHITWSIDRAAGKKPFSSVEAINRLIGTEQSAPREHLPVETTPEVCG